MKFISLVLCATCILGLQMFPGDGRVHKVDLFVMTLLILFAMPETKK